MEAVAKKPVVQEVPVLRFGRFNGAWKKARLDAVTEKIQDGTHFSPPLMDVGPYKYISARNIRNGKMLLHDMQYVDEEHHREIYKRSDVRFGDVLLTKDGASTGNVCLNELKDEFSLLSSVAFIRADDVRSTNDFIYQYLFSPYGQKEVKSVIAGQAITRITLQKLRAFRFHFPTLPEQQKIAGFLSAVDARIQQLTRKKALLEQYKKGVMQQLFSQEIRFTKRDGSAFAEWEEKRLGEVARFNPKSRKLPDSFVYIDLESVEAGVLLKEDTIELAGAPSRAQRLLERNDILFQLVRPYQKNNLLFDRAGAYVASTGYAQIRAKGNPGFLYQYLHYQPFVNHVLDRSTGSNYPAIRSSDLSEIEINIPSLEEQQKIAGFLGALDARVQAVGAQLAGMQRWKKGLLQGMFV